MFHRSSVVRERREKKRDERDSVLCSASGAEGTGSDLVPPRPQRYPQLGRPPPPLLRRRIFPLPPFNFTLTFSLSSSISLIIHSISLLFSGCKPSRSLRAKQARGSFPNCRFSSSQFTLYLIIAEISDIFCISCKNY